MSATVIPIGGALLSKRQLAEHYGRSTRWVELQVAQGMPSRPPTHRFPHRRFSLAEVEAWLRDGAHKPSIGERVAAMEQQLASLTAMLTEMREGA